MRRCRVMRSLAAGKSPRLLRYTVLLVRIRPLSLALLLLRTRFFALLRAPPMRKSVLCADFLVCQSVSSRMYPAIPLPKRRETSRGTRLCMVDYLRI